MVFHRSAFLWFFLFSIQCVQSQHLWMSLDQFGEYCGQLEGYHLQLIEKDPEGYHAFIVDAHAKAFHIRMLPLKEQPPTMVFGQSFELNGMRAELSETPIVSKLLVYNTSYLTEIQIITTGNQQNNSLHELAGLLDFSSIELPDFHWPQEVGVQFRPTGKVLFMQLLPSTVEGFSKYLEVTMLDTAAFRQSLKMLKSSNESSDDFIAFDDLLMLASGHKLSSLCEGEPSHWPIKLKYYIR